ncbi:MAG: beta-ketoacyl-ACP synthase II [Candidatus Eisenbacteria bacterium]|nr:beta-ketoacyl-ACP synthase II [Candidatus Eisenbacteria bacterium]
MSGRTAAVTGIGAITPIGSGREALWDALVAGANGAGPITRFDASAYAVRIACEVKDFDPDKHIDKRESRKMDLCTQYGVAAALMAWKDSGLADCGFDPSRAGAIIGSGVGGIQTLEDQHSTLLSKGPRRVSPYFIPMLIADMPAGMTSILLGLRGPNFATVSACASGAHAIGEALRAIQRGDADVVVTGGCEAAVCPLAAAGFASMKALSSRNDDPARASRPFDAGRDGFVLGEGAGIVVLEELEHAKRRGARIDALLVGYGATADAYHMTAPDPGGEGAAAAMAAALSDAHASPDEVQYVNAHGTSTPLNDKCETEALKAVFGDHAKRLAVSSTKSMIGHLLGAAGGVEFAATALAIANSVVPPTINYETPDPECDLDYVPNQARDARITLALTNSFGFGGHNAVLALRRFEGQG